MTDLEHRVGVREASLVVRHLKLEGINDNNKPLIIEEIDHKFGIDNVSFDDKSSTLNVAYDAISCNLDGIEETIKKHGADVAHDWWTHFKEGYYRYVDQNVKDNANYTPHCCNKAPPSRRKK